MATKNYCRINDLLEKQIFSSADVEVDVPSKKKEKEKLFKITAKSKLVQTSMQLTP